MEPNKKLMSCSWRQPYLNWSQHTPNYQSAKTELAVLDAIDNLISSGLTHSIADAILRSLMVNSKE
jgi:hypothetical protein